MKQNTVQSRDSGWKKNDKERSPRITHRRDDVCVVLDQVKAEDRTALTAPECRRVCDAYGIPLPEEGLA
ncbi:MAG: hypothetical protein VCC36_01725, partial [Gammaproteobacteria bacterium]